MYNFNPESTELIWKYLNLFLQLVALNVFHLTLKRTRRINNLYLKFLSLINLDILFLNTIIKYVAY